MQWCTGKGQWIWSSAQRTSSNHRGVPGTIYLDITSAGAHDIHLAQREDGFEVDRFILVKDASYKPSGAGPAESPRK